MSDPAELQWLPADDPASAEQLEQVVRSVRAGNTTGLPWQLHMIWLDGFQRGAKFADGRLAFMGRLRSGP